MKVKKIHKMGYEGIVHNLSVKDNHNYVADGLLVSNCHKAKSYSINQIGKKCTNADYRIGFTGTMYDDINDIYNVESVLGPVLIKRQTKDGIEQGVVSKINIINILLRHNNKTVNIIKHYDEEVRKLSAHLNKLKKEQEETGKENSLEITGITRQRTKLKREKYQYEVDLVKMSNERMCIFDWIFSKVPKGQNSLILVQHIEQINNIERYLIENLDDDYKVMVIHGSIKNDQREIIRKLVDKEENLIIVATYGTMSTGVNMKKLHNVIFASSYKSKITIMQSIGRGLRKAKDKQKMILWDIVDDLTYETKNGAKKTNYLFNHFKERLSRYVQQKFNFKTIKLEIEKLI